VQVTTERVQANDITKMLKGWELSLRSANRSERTRDTYSTAVRQFAAFLREQGMPTAVDKITREYIEAFLVAVRERTSASTAETRYRGLRQFFKWCREEGEFEHSPMEHMKPPKVGEVEVYVPTVDDVEAMLKPLRNADLKHWTERRDAAIISLFATAGLRLSELTSLTVDDVDLDTRRGERGGIVKVHHGKGDKFRVVGLRDDAANLMMRWLRVRDERPQAETPYLWLGTKGAMTPSGIRQMIWRRSEAAGVPRLHPHQLRHHFASEWLRAGKSESNLMQIAGWSSRSMLDAVYARGTRSERALEEHLRD
jgi:site-specific recombinase XerD